MTRLLIISLTFILCAMAPYVAWAQKSPQGLMEYRPLPQPTSKEIYSEAKRLYSEGVKYALTGLFSQAAQLFQRAVRLDPEFADAHFALGHAYSDMGHWQKAIESFERAIELNPRDLEAQDRLQHARTMLDSETKPLAVGEPVSLESKPAPPPAELALTKIYRVGPGDVLDIRVNNSSATQSTLFTVTPAGLLEHPILTEPLSVRGLSVEEIAASIEADIQRRALIDNPKVSVGVRDYASHTILVSGLVKDSGTKILRREAIPLYVVVADAQPLPEAAIVTVLRNESNEAFEIELSQPAEMNLLVRPGDVITLHANTTQFFYVGGEVKSPGEKTHRRGLTLTQAIIVAGGVTRKSKEARIGRDDGRGFLMVTRHRLKDIESGKAPDPLIRPGDRITILN